MGEALRRLGRLVEHAMTDVEILRSLAVAVLDALGKARADERERCIAAMVASQPEGMRAVMQQRYREIMEAGK
jgi:hypothetical protein